MISGSRIVSWLNNMLGYNTIGSSSQSTYYLALSTTDPGTQLTEPSDSHYQRQNIRTGYGSSKTSPAFTVSAYDTSTQSATATNAYDIVFPKATTTWGTITHFAICDSSTGSSVVAWGALTSSISPTANTVPIIETGDAIIKITQST